MPQLPTTFAALGDPTRFAIVDRLLREGEKPAGDLLDVAKISAPAMSRHFKVLREAGIIQQRIDKQRRLYSVRAEAVRGISDWTLSYQQFWDQSLTRLAAQLEE